MRIQTVSTSLDHATTLRDAEVVAERLRAEGFTVEVGKPFTVREGRKAGLAAVALTIAEKVPESAPEPPAPEPALEEPAAVEASKPRGNPGLGRISWQRAHPGEDYDAWVAAGKPKTPKRETVVA